MGPRSVPPQLRTSILRAMAQRRQNGGHWTSFNLASPSNPSSEATQSLPTFASSPSTGSSLPSPFHFFRRSFSSGSDASQDAIIIGSEEDFDKSLKRVQEGALPAIFYFSAAWCGPCKFLSPVVNQLSKMYPPCVTYKIDIDMEGMQNRLSELGISAVPTLNFFNGGKQVGTVVGADVQKIKEIMDRSFK